MKPTKGSMTVGLTPAQWEELCVSKQRLFVRAAFYLGMPYNFIQNRCKYDAHEEERNETIETAIELGMNDKDQVFILQRNS